MSGLIDYGAGNSSQEDVMPLLRFVVTAILASMLIRATFANTVVWRHRSALTIVRHAPDKAFTVERVANHSARRVN